LRILAVVGKTAEEIAACAETFGTLAHAQLWLPDFTALNAHFEPATAPILAEAYFAISEAYKRERLKPGSRTEWTKAAAFSAATVAIVKPLRPIGAPTDPLWPLINPMFAMTCAYGHVRNMFGAKPFDEKNRMYRALMGLELPSLAVLIDEGNATRGKFQSKWEITLSRQELALLDLLVAYFVQLQENEHLLLKLGAAAVSLAT
jgi:hypothetical protein